MNEDGGGRQPQPEGGMVIGVHSLSEPVYGLRVKAVVLTKSRLQGATPQP